MGQTSDLDFADNTARAAVIYTEEKYLSEEPTPSLTYWRLYSSVR